MGSSGEEILVSLPDMIDCAVGHPEVGAVNFNVLHALLHITIQQLNLSKTQVHFKGNDAERMKNLMSMKPQTTNLFTEFAIDNVKEEGENAPKKITFSRDKIDAMEKEVAEIKTNMNNLLSAVNNEEVLRQMDEDKEVLKPTITNMWSYLHITQRVQAVEQGMEKITSMLEDLEKQRQDTSADFNGTRRFLNAAEEESEKTDDIETTDKKIHDLYEIVDQLQERVNQITGTLGEVEDIVNKDDKNQEKPSTELSEKSGKDDKDREKPSTELSEKSSINKTPSLLEIKKDIEQLKVEIRKFKSSKPKSEEDTGSDTEIEPKNENTLEEIKQLHEKIHELDRMVFNQAEQVTQQISDLEKEIGVLTERVNAGPSIEEHSEAVEVSEIGGLTEIYNKLRAMQEHIDNMNAVTEQLQEHKDERSNQIESLNEAIEYLKVIKADKEDLEDALADKADQQALNRKVSHDQFDAACDDLTKSLEDALCKLGQQEDIWRQALDSLQSDIGQKLDKSDIQPLRDFINIKLKSLQDRVRALTDLKKETEAAGTKSKFLRDVTCISCDQNVVMRRDLPHPPVASTPPLPAKRSMKPYLTYELDAVRRQIKKLPGRNLNDFEASVKEGAKVKDSEKPDIVKTLPTDHLCNRYCGGSHTIITPQQRITHVGHFLKQWGLEVKPITEGLSKGTDGRFYRTREDDRRQSKRSSRKGSPASSRPTSGLKISETILVELSPKAINNDQTEPNRKLNASNMENVLNKES